MKMLLFLVSGVIPAASACMAVRQIKAKKPIADTYLLQAVHTFLIALRMAVSLPGSSFWSP